MQNLIGTTAGQIWQYLSRNNYTLTAQKFITTTRLKTALGVSDRILHLALGWLSRENKIEIEAAENTFRVSLK